jgi:hypothetical protein
MVPDDELVLAIAANDTLLHVGPAAAIAAHYAEQQPVAPQGVQLPATEFYDSAGCPLTHVPGDGRTAAGLDRDAEHGQADCAARRLLVDRIDLVLAHAQVVRDRQLAHPDGDAGFGPARVLRVSGDLAGVLAALAAVDDSASSSHSQPNPGGWFHNLMHSAFG